MCVAHIPSSEELRSSYVKSDGFLERHLKNENRPRTGKSIGEVDLGVCSEHNQNTPVPLVFFDISSF